MQLHRVPEKLPEMQSGISTLNAHNTLKAKQIINFQKLTIRIGKSYLAG